MTTRQELMQHFGLVSVASPALSKAHDIVTQQDWRGGADQQGHGTYWHTSFHASSFPADFERACGRQALYTMMDIPDKEPISEALRGMMEVGNAIEDWVVSTYHRAGMLLSAPPGAKQQTTFKSPEHWLAGHVDAIIRPPGWNRPHVLEVKSKDHEVITNMRRGERKWDEKHRRQCLTYVGLGHIASMFLWPELEPISSGSILYISRQRPDYRHEFFFSLNEEAMELGFAKLAEWKQLFIEGRLPERVKEWQWTVDPCKDCVFKNMKMPDGTKVGCKEDIKRGITDMSQSTTIDFAKTVNPNYSYEQARERVLRRWA